MQMAAERTEAALGAFSRALGAHNVLVDPKSLAPHLIDWSGDFRGTALAAVLPSNTAEVVACLHIAREHGLAVVPQGGNTGLVGGACATDANGQILVNLRRMNRVRSIDSLNFSMEVEAGAILEDIKSAAEAEDLFFPLAFGSQGSCQIGGNIATNAGGLNVLRYGMTRNLVLGLEAVLPDGRIFNGLGRLWKDNRGIDLKHLFIGAEGTTGIITAAVLKLVVKPENVETCLLAVESVAAATAIFQEARRNFGDLLSAFELIDADCIRLARATYPQLQMPIAGDHPVYVLIELSASRAIPLRDITETFLADLLERDLLQDAAMASSQDQARRIWALREALVEAQAVTGRHFRSDVSLPISEIADFLSEANLAVATASPGCRPLIYGHIGDGNIHYNVLPPDTAAPEQIAGQLEAVSDALYGTVERFSGSISAEHGIGRYKRARFLKGIDPVHRQLLQTVVGGIDVRGSMNPGCVLPISGAESDE